jgi:hypothetical protein
MDTAELLARLGSIGVPEDAYRVGGDRNESYCLITEGGRWKVYYSERGQRVNEAVFADEGGACQRLLDELMRDTVVRRLIEERKH